MMEDAGELEQPIRRQADDAVWRALLEAAGRRAQAQRLTEDDVPRLVAEVRRERRAD